VQKLSQAVGGTSPIEGPELKACAERRSTLVDRVAPRASRWPGCSYVPTERLGDGSGVELGERERRLQLDLGVGELVGGQAGGERAP